MELPNYTVLYLQQLSSLQANGELQTSTNLYVKVPISSIFLIFLLVWFYISPNGLLPKEKFDLNKMQSFLEVLKTFEFAAILVHHSRQSSLRFEIVVM